MRLLLITNLYPPQELGGYGRCMADFCWGLKQRGHQLQVICSDAGYLGIASKTGPSGEPVARELLLKGDFCNGVHLMQNAAEQHAVDQHNQAVIQHWLEKIAGTGFCWAISISSGRAPPHTFGYTLPFCITSDSSTAPTPLTNNQKL